jgi:hypothetical protein
MVMKRKRGIPKERREAYRDVQGGGRLRYKSLAETKLDKEKTTTGASSYPREKYHNQDI